MSKGLHGSPLLKGEAERTGRTRPGSSQWCPITGQETMGKKWNTGSSMWASGKTFLLWGLPSTVTDFPVRLWSIHLWRQSKLDLSWAICCSSHHLSRRAGLCGLQRYLSTSLVWFYDSVMLVIKERRYCRKVGALCAPFPNVPHSFLKLVSAFENIVLRH